MSDKKTPKPLKPLDKAGNSELEILRAAASRFLGAVAAAKVVPLPHLRQFMYEFATRFRQTINAKKPDKKALEHDRLVARRLKIDAQIAANEKK